MDTITDALTAARNKAESDHQAAERDVEAARRAWDEARERLTVARLARDRQARQAARVLTLLEQAKDPELTPEAQASRRADAEALARGE